MSRDPTPGTCVAVERRACLRALSPDGLDGWRVWPTARPTDGRGFVVELTAIVRVTAEPRDDAGVDLTIAVSCELPPGADATVVEIVRQELDGALRTGLERVERVVGKDSVQEASEESFPASDPPAWTSR